MRRRTYFDKQLIFIKSIIVPLPVVLWDTKNNEFVQTQDLSHADLGRHKPIGIIVIPAGHNVYGTGECGIVSLMDASLTTPDTGSTTRESIYWGPRGNVTGIYDRESIPQVGIESGSMNNYAIVNNVAISWDNGRSGLILPTDKLDPDVCSRGIYTKSIDGLYYYQPTESGWNKCAPSPFLEDGTRNPTYHDRGPINAFADFNGKSASSALCNISSGQPNWKTDQTITNQNSGYPAAWSCWRYHTVGTNQGDWYLPACGELGYLNPQIKRINQTITTLQEWSHEIYCDFLMEQLFSSTPENYDCVWINDIPSGVVMRQNKSQYKKQVRPFARMLPPKCI